jgi:WW domain-containing oxidoreductase
MSLYGLIAGKGPTGFGYGSTAEDVTEGLSLAGKTILVTGTNSGIGQETVRVLVKRGATVIGTARTREKANEAGKAYGAQFIGVACELSEPTSVRSAVREVLGMGVKLDALIANAGIMALPKLEMKHGYELQFLTNHIGHFILVTGLLDALTPSGRVIMLSSEAHRNAPREGIDFDNLSGERSYGAWSAYGRSKLANLLFAKQLARRFGKSGRTANAVHPGVIATNLGRHMNPLVHVAFAISNPIALKSIPEGAATQTYAAVSPGAATWNGEYLSNSNIAKPRADANDESLAQKLWDRTEEIVAKL